jgi:O-antigen/teichoic acid export membrane protein
MEPNEFGRLAFCLSVLLITGPLLEFGVFAAGARLLALSKDEDGARRQLGGLAVLAAFIGAAYGLFLVSIAIPLGALFKTDVHWLLIQTAALASLQPFQSLIEFACQGLNRIRRLSIFQLMMSGSYLVFVAALAVTNKLTAGAALVAWLTASAIASLWTLARLRPSFESIGETIRLTLREVRHYGLNLYFAKITGSVATRLDSLVIGYFLGRSSAGLAPLGLYALAQKMANPLLAMSRAVAISRFRSFANRFAIPRHISTWTAALLILAAAALAFVGPLALPVVFPKYAEAAPLLIPFAIYGLFAGLFQSYNAFLASHGRGAELRNIAILVAAFGVIGLTVTVPKYGILGAAWTAATAMAMDYVLHLYYYRKVIRTLASTNDGTHSNEQIGADAR